jgi:hypothetical protein
MPKTALEHYPHLKHFLLQDSKETPQTETQTPSSDMETEEKHRVLRILLNKLHLIEACGEVGRKRRMKRHNYKVWETFENRAVDFDGLIKDFVFEKWV